MRYKTPLSVLWFSAAYMLALCGCSGPDPVFPKDGPQLGWPQQSKPARIIYVGQLSTEADLHPRKGGLTQVRDQIVGTPGIAGVLTPYAVCTDDADRLFVADTGSQSVHVFNLHSREYQQWKPTGNAVFTQPVGVAWDTTGRLIVSDSTAGCLFVFDRGGGYLASFGQGILQRPAGIAIDRLTHRILVCDVGLHQVLVFSADGKPLSRIGQRGVGPSEFNFPTHLAFDSRGNLYVTDSLNFRIQVFDRDLKFVRCFGEAGNLPGYFAQPKGIAFDSDDHLYVVDNRQEIVQLFDGDDRLLMYFGGEGNKPGQFWLPAGICIDSHNRIWVADCYNKRVDVFDYLPEKKP